MKVKQFLKAFFGTILGIFLLYGGIKFYKLDKAKQNYLSKNFSIYKGKINTIKTETLFDNSNKFQSMKTKVIILLDNGKQFESDEYNNILLGKVNNDGNFKVSQGLHKGQNIELLAEKYINSNQNYLKIIELT